MSDAKPHVSKDKKVRIKDKKVSGGHKHCSLKVWTYYEEKDGTLVRKRDHCPRCGPGAFLSKHKNRRYCGRCGFAQFNKSGAVSDNVPEEKREESGKDENTVGTQDNQQEANKEENTAEKEENKDAVQDNSDQENKNSPEEAEKV